MEKFKCKFCQNNFYNNSNLLSHQKKAKYCLKIQGKIEEVIFKCDGCKKILSSKRGLINHIEKCFKYQEKKFYEKYDQEKKDLIEKYELQLREKDRYLEMVRQDYKELVDKYVKNSEEKIQLLNKKYLKRRERKNWGCENVIYILTTPGLKKERRYILGKTSNLTNRLSTYNKSDEHEVVFHKSCGDKNNMKVVEEMVFIKLNKYREQANRERFILPENMTVNTFISTITQCINFVEN